MKLSEHFTLEELTSSSTAKRYKIDNTPDANIIAKLKILCRTILEPLRERYGKPIIISSGYRCPALNKLVGGASASDHQFGNAADIHSVSDTVKCNKELFNCAKKLMDEGKLANVKQLIDEYGYNWIHISFQDGRTTKRNQVLHLK